MVLVSDVKSIRINTMRAIVLVSDAYGGRGGIALYKRHFLRALCSYPNMEQVVAVPRFITYDLEEMPQNLSYVASAAGSKLKFLKECLRQLFSKGKFDLIVCGHLHLLPFAFFLKLFYRCPMVPLIYGVEAWMPTTHGMANYLSSKVDAFISIRKLTAHRFKKWAGIENAKFYYLPNCIDESKYGINEKRTDLMGKYNLYDKKVIMTAGRMDPIEYPLHLKPLNQKKGFDEVLELLPDLRKLVPNIVYLVVGDGNDKSRLEKKAKALGVNDIVCFSGYAPEEGKADFYRLADVFVMPGSNPLFDRYPFRFVFLEALACGVPVVGCSLEDESECSDSLTQKLIVQVNPNDKNDVKRGILQALEIGKGLIPGIENFYYVTFEEKLHGFLDSMLVQSR